MLDSTPRDKFNNDALLNLKSFYILKIINQSKETQHLHIHYLQFVALLFDIKIDKLETVDLKWILTHETNASPSTLKESLQNQILGSITEYYKNPNIKKGSQGIITSCMHLNSAFKSIMIENLYYIKDKKKVLLKVLLSEKYIKQYCILLGVPYRKQATLEKTIQRMFEAFYLQQRWRSPAQMQLFAALYQYATTKQVVFLAQAPTIEKALAQFNFSTQIKARKTALKLRHFIKKHRLFLSSSTNNLMDYFKLILNYWRDWFKIQFRSSKNNNPRLSFTEQKTTYQRIANAFAKNDFWDLNTDNYHKKITQLFQEKNNIYSLLSMARAQYNYAIKSNLRPDDQKKLEKKLALTESKLYFFEKLSRHKLISHKDAFKLINKIKASLPTALAASENQIKKCTMAFEQRFIKNVLHYNAHYNLKFTQHKKCYDDSIIKSSDEVDAKPLSVPHARVCPF